MDSISLAARPRGDYSQSCDLTQLGAAGRFGSLYLHPQLLTPRLRLAGPPLGD